MPDEPALEPKQSVFSLSTYSPSILGKMIAQVAVVTGLLLVGAVGLGKFMDAQLGTRILFTVLLTVVGSQLAFLITYRIAMRAAARTDREKPWPADVNPPDKDQDLAI